MRKFILFGLMAAVAVPAAAPAQSRGEIRRDREDVREEREEIFPKVRKSGLDLAALGERLRIRKEELNAVPEALREEALVSMMA